jgi:hypothetical protein
MASLGASLIWQGGCFTTQYISAIEYWRIRRIAMFRHVRVALIVGALATSGVAAHAQDAKPAPPPSRAAERQAPPARVSSGGGDRGGGGDRAVARVAPAPRAEAPRAATPPASAGATASSGDQSRRQGSGRDQSRQRTAPPQERRGSGDGDRAVARRDGTPREGSGTAYPVRATERGAGGRQSFGTATARRYPPRPGYGGGGYYPGWGYPYYASYPYYPLSLGFFWDPFWGYGSPYGGGYYGYGRGYGGGYGYGYDGGYGAYAGPTYQIYGGLRLKMKPREAEVFVDGYFAGVVDDFDGAFQQLNLDVGPHRIEVRAAGHEPISFEIRTQPHEKITFKGELKPIP